jgi:hypothetical protein
VAISNSIFRNNAAGAAGAIYIVSSAVTLTSCTIVDNEAACEQCQFAGGIYVESSSVSFILSSIEGNVAALYGGGLVAEGYSALLLLSGSEAGSEGGVTQLTISESQVIGNTASFGSGGGAVVMQGSNGTLVDTQFESNTALFSATASAGGGGLAHTGLGEQDALGLRLILSGVSFSDNVDENEAQAHDLLSYNANTVVRETCPTQGGYYFLALEGAALTVNDDGTASGTLSSFTCLPQCAPDEERKTPNHPCTACIPGKYGNDGFYDCSACPAGSFNVDSGSTSVAACSACSPGT